MRKPWVILQWYCSATLTRDYRWVRSYDGLPAESPFIFRVLDRMRAFGFEKILVELLSYPAPWLPREEAERSLAAARDALTQNGIPFVVRTEREVPPLPFIAFDRKAWGEFWSEKAPGNEDDTYLFVSVRDFLVPEKDLYELAESLPQNAPGVVWRTGGMPGEVPCAYNRGAFRTAYTEGNIPESIVRRIPQSPIALGAPIPFEHSFAYSEVFEAVVSSGPPASWSYAGLESIHQASPDLFRPLWGHLGVELTNEENLPNRLRAPSRISCRPTGRMSVEDWATILDGCPIDLTSISIDLWDFGEPLLHTKALEWIEGAARRGIRIDLYTNGLLLDQAASERLVASGCEAVFFRLDAAGAETYARVTGGATTYETAARNLDTLCAVKRKKYETEYPPPPCHPIIAVQCTEMSETQGDLDSFLEKYDEAGRAQNALRKEGGNRAESLAEIWKESYKRSMIEYAMIRHDNLFRGRVRRDEGTDVTPLRRFPCRQLHEGLYVLWDGRVVPCREDVDAESVLGHVREGLLDLWRGDRLASLFSAHDRKEWTAHPLCGTCKEWYYPFA